MTFFLTIAYPCLPPELIGFGFGWPLIYGITVAGQAFDVTKNLSTRFNGV